MDIGCVGAIVRDGEGRIVVVRRGRPPGEGRWSIPGGRVEAGETDREAVRREVSEETGLAVVVEGLAGSVILPAIAAADRYVVNDYFAHVEPGTPSVPIAGDDAAEARWVSRAEFSSLAPPPELAATLDEWAVWQQIAAP